MIITITEFKELGFICDAQNEKLLETCIRRAEYVLNALCGGTLASAMAQSKSSAALVKQAAAFEANAIFQAELSKIKEEQTLNKENTSTHVSLGDLSYTESSGSSKASSLNGSADSTFNVTRTVERLLRAAGCFPYTAAEVI